MALSGSYGQWSFWQFFGSISTEQALMAKKFGGGLLMGLRNTLTCSIVEFKDSLEEMKSYF